MVEIARAKENAQRTRIPTRAWCAETFLEDTAIGVGDLATKKRSVGLNKSTQRAIHYKTCCKDTFVNGQTQPAQR